MAYEWWTSCPSMGCEKRIFAKGTTILFSLPTIETQLGNEQPRYRQKAGHTMRQAHLKTQANQPNRTKKSEEFKKGMR